MTLMRDAELLYAIKQGEIVRGLPDFNAEPYSRDSAIQPSSVDFTIGSILLPETPSGSERLLRSVWRRRAAKAKNHWLAQGEMAVLVTKEKFNLPANVGAVTFPPSRVAFKGLLVTNPGHIDPGYEGQMRFTVINMAREKIELRVGTPIATVLFFMMREGAEKDHKARGLDRLVPDADEVAKRLSPDFLGFESRAEDAARSTVARWSSWVLGILIVPLFLLLLGTIWTNEWWPLASESQLDRLDRRVGQVEGVLRGIGIDLPERTSAGGSTNHTGPGLASISSRLDAVEDGLANAAWESIGQRLATAELAIEAIESRHHRPEGSGGGRSDSAGSSP